MLTKRKISQELLLRLLRSGQVAFEPLTLLDVQEQRPEQTSTALLTLAWGTRQWRFAVECKGRSTPKAIAEAAYSAKAYARSLGCLPMVLVPYLDEARLTILESESVSGADASGNLLITVPEQVLIRRSGNPNLYPESVSGINPYSGSYAVVSRALLGRPSFSTVNAVAAYLKERGAGVALSTISKASKALEEDVAVRREAGRGRKQRTGPAIQTIQPGLILDKLAAQAGPQLAARALVKFTPGLAALAELARRSSIRLVATGETSASRYTPMGWQQSRPEFYCDDLAGLIRASENRLVATDLFPDLALLETDDPGVYFDSQADENGIPWAPPLQAFLELARGGKREKELALELRANVLRI